MAEARETVWVPSAAHGFLPAFVAAAVDAPPSDLVEYSVCLGANRKRLSTVDATGTVPLSELRPREASASCVGDMTELTDVSEPALLHNLYLRFCADHIYSSVGGILVSVNPYKAVPRLYDERTVSHYRTYSLTDETSEAPSEPHLYAIVEAAYRELLTSGVDQVLNMPAHDAASARVPDGRALTRLCFRRPS